MRTDRVRELRLAPGGRHEVSALFVRPPEARSMAVLGHGAGAGMRHPFMEAIAERLAARRVATLRYQFPAMEAGRRFPDPLPVRLATVVRAVDRAAELADGLPVVAGGKSMGGRMTSAAAAEGRLPDLKGLLFLGFPLHPPKKPGIERAGHLDRVAAPMLFLQGDRDRLARLDLLTPVVERLGPRATLHVVRGADHGFAVLKRSGRTAEEVLDELADTTVRWLEEVI